MSLPPSEVLLGSLFIEGFAYGICTALGIIALIINTRNREKRERVHVLIFSLLLFALVVATAHIALACVQVLIVFVKKADGVPLGSLVHSVTTSNRLFVARMALHMIQMSLIDGLVVWLFFVNFDRRKQSKVFLAATWSIILVSACWLVVQSTLPHASTMSPTSVLGWARIYQILMFVNILHSFAAIIRNKYSNGNTTTTDLDRFPPAVVPLIQSSKVSTACVAALLAALSMAISGYVVAVDLLVPLAPAILCSLILRPGLKHLRSSREYSSIKKKAEIVRPTLSALPKSGDTSEVHTEVNTSEEFAEQV